VELAEAFIALRVHSEQVAKDVDKGLRAGAATGSTAAGQAAGAGFAGGFRQRVGPVFTKAVNEMAKAGVVSLGIIGVASLRMAGEFQKGLTTLVTGAGESERNLKLVGDGIKNIAVNTGTTTKQLVEGMFMIESAGYHGKAGLDVLRAAAEGAKIGNADLGAVANAVTTVMTDYALKGAGAATKATDALVVTVSRGKTHLQDLATSMARILPVAASLHIGVGQVGGAMATMTGEGTSARLAAMGLNATILAMVAPNAHAAKTMLSLGLSSKAVADTLTKRGLIAALQMVSAAAKKAGPEGSPAYVAAMKSMLGGTNGLRVGLQLTGTHMSTLIANTKAVSAAFDGGKGHVIGWALVQKDFNQQLEVLKARAEVAGISIGQVLLPVVSKLVGIFAGHTKEILIFVGAVLGLAIAAKIVMTVMKAWEVATAIWAAVTDSSLVSGIALWIMYTLGVESAGAATIIATGGIILILAALAIGAYELYRHWDTVWKFIKAVAVDAWHWAMDLIHNKIFNIILGIMFPLALLALHWRTTWADAKRIATDAWHWAMDLIHNKIFNIILACVVPLAFLALHWRATWADLKRVARDFYTWLWTDFGAKFGAFFTRTIPGWWDTAVTFARTRFVTPIENAFLAVWNWLTGTLGTNIRNLFTVTIPGYFTTAVQGIGRAWGAIQHAVGAPVNWVITHVINGLIGAFDWVSSKVGGPNISKLAPLPGFAAGGRVTVGTGPTSDDVLARVSRNETIVSAAHSAVLAADFAAVGVPGYAKGGTPHGTQPKKSGPGSGIIGDILGFFGKASELAKIMAALGSGNKVALGNAIMGLAGGGGTGGAVADLSKLLVDVPATLLKDAIAALFKVFGSGSSSSIVSYAMSFLGKIPYVWGGTSLSAMGADCSGFTQSVYSHFGIGAPRTSEAQGAWVKRGSPTPGGLAFYHSPAGGADPGHVAIVRNAASVISQGGGMGPTLMGINAMPLLWTGTPPLGFGKGAGGPSGHVPGNVQGWLQAAMVATGRPGWWLPPLEKIQGLETDNLANMLTVVNPNGGATGLMQVKPGTFAQFATVPGGIFNPVANAVAAIRHIMSAWNDSPLNIPGIGSPGPYRGYGTGGRIPEDVLGIGSSGQRYLFHGGENVSPAGSMQQVETGLEGHLEGIIDMLGSVAGALSGGSAALAAGARAGAHQAYYGVGR
jgi:TP901 family phage tail tape measure protein